MNSSDSYDYCFSISGGSRPLAVWREKLCKLFNITNPLLKIFFKSGNLNH